MPHQTEERVGKDFWTARSSKAKNYLRMQT
jgi:hypothetical protein